MASQNSAVLPFDPDAEELPEGLPAPSEEGGEVVLLLADPATRESGWAPRAAVALARGWAGAGHRVFLMDCHPGEPSLHGLLGEDNGEGVSDAVLYGVSPSRMARNSSDGFLFAPAGTVVADPGSVLRHPRWSSVLSACREAGSVVLLYLPAGVPGVDHLVAEGDRSIRLRTAAAADGSAEPGVLTLRPVRPQAGSSSGRREEEVGAESAERGGVEQEVASAGPSRSTKPIAPPSTGKRPARKGKKSSDRRVGRWLLSLFVILVILAAAVWLGLVELPGLAGNPMPDVVALLGAP
ncbi:MAG: hypothetical protein WD960_04945 [Gemmatimonadota bacterium]